MRRKVLWGIGGLIVLGAAAVAAVHFGRERIQVPGPPPGAARLPLDRIDHSAYDALLRKYVDDQGMVAYRKWKADGADGKALDDYLAMLGTANLEAPAPREAKLAFWINAYNALTLKGILREYPTTSIRNHTPLVGYHIWKDLVLTVDGKPHSLHHIEHDILRKMDEPRIHFAIVCASKGCPPLWNRAYTAADLNAQLDANSRRFFARPANFRVEADRHTIHISPLLEWYAGDFAPSQGELLQRLKPYLPDGNRLTWLQDDDVQLIYPDYDWGLNDQAPVQK